MCRHRCFGEALQDELEFAGVGRDVADGELRLVRADQMVKPGWADRFHDAMKKKKAERKGS